MSHPRRGPWLGASALAVLVSSAAVAQHCAEPGCETGDLDQDCAIGLTDLSILLANFGVAPADPNQGDLDGNQAIDIADVSLLLAVFGADCGPVVSDETSADLTAYRPQHGAGYAPFAKTAVSDADEESETLGPGIRINAPGDDDSAGEDDLIELRLVISDANVAFALRRSDPALAAWTTRDKQPATQIPFTSNRTEALPFGGQTTLTLWIEWASPSHGAAEMSLERLDNGALKDAVTFHTFRGIVMALGGEGQVPSNPVDPSSGTFVVAAALYPLGYDVHMYDEDHVDANGAGAVYDEVVTAVQSRGVEEVAVFGYSHGGGSTYHLAQRLDNNRAGIGVFEITYTSYVDSVRNNSDIDVNQELRRPPSSGFHVNHYQHGTLADFFLDGGPVPNSNPPPTGLDVETTPWGAASTHFEVDDYVQVRTPIATELMSHIAR